MRFERTRPQSTSRKNNIMSDNLYSSLLSLLPRDYVIEGNSSVCDNIEMAANYIKDLEKNIKELKDKRKKLIMSATDDQIPNVGPSTISSINPSINDNYVKIKACLEAIEIEINVKVEEDQENAFLLSKVLKVLQLEEGLSVVNCSYSKVNDQSRCIYFIHCQVDDGILVDSSRLQCRLTNEISLLDVS